MAHFPCPTRTACAQDGFSLLEVLISILLLTIGALGAAGMQITALRDAGSATNRYRAASLLNTMSDTLRAERSLAIDGNPSRYISTLSTGTCNAAAITPITRWQNQIDCELPGGKGSVAISQSRAVITVEWNDSRGSSGSTSQKFSVETRL